MTLAVEQAVKHHLFTFFARILTNNCCYFLYSDSVSILREYPDEIMVKMVDLVEEVTYEENEYIIRQGQMGDTFYIIKKGEVSANC